MSAFVFLCFSIGVFNLGNNLIDIQQNEYIAQVRFYLEQGQILKELIVPDFYGYKTAPEGQYLYVLNSDGINVYNGEGQRVSLIRDKGMFAVSSNDQYLICASDDNIRLYEQGKLLFQIRVISPAIRQLVFSGDNQYLGVMMRNHFSLIGLDDRQKLWTKEFTEPLIFCKFSNDKIILALESRPSLNGKIYVLSLNGQIIQEENFQYQQYDEQIGDIQILPDGIKAKTHLREWFVKENTLLQTTDYTDSHRFSNNPSNQLNPWLQQDTIPWPLAPTDSLHPIGNSWAEFQNYGGSSYYHPGVDILSPEIPNVPVYAVKRGYIKAWLSTGNYLYWRFAIADSSLSYTDSCNAYLYAHIDSALYHKDIGDTVQVGELIGYLVYWPVDSIHFHHIHFAKIRDRGATWTAADWAFVFNPLISLSPNQDTISPRFENALTNQKFAFTRNNTSTYLSSSNLNGDVDIIAKIHDKFSVSTGDTIWDRLTPLKIEYEIIGQTVSQPKKLSFIFDKVIPPSNTVNVVYKSDNTCRTRGNYDYRDYFFIVTNTDGDSIVETTDAAFSWQTNNFPNGDYWVKIYASDASDNVSVCSMQVTVANAPAIEEYDIANRGQIKYSQGVMYNALGQKVNSTYLKPGIYFYRKDSNNVRKLLIIKPMVYIQH
ncbi:MAG: hypothetical protein KGZ86_06975 [Candidatus Latescibacteria bacterium]|nr:hypothetical protein [Candidatus Latescibacterota bacterium]